MTMTAENGSLTAHHAGPATDGRIRWRVCDSPADLAEQLAARVAADLARAAAARGKASLVLPGGRTPRPFYRALAGMAVPWEAVTVVPSDERWVREDDPRANLGAIRAAFAGTEAARARLISLYEPTAATPEQAIPAIRRRLASCPAPHDWVILGMGTDGHVASLFPGISRAAAGGELVAAPPAPRPPGIAEPRISLGLPLLASGRQVALLITGWRKRRVFEAALAGKANPPLPVRLLAEAAAALDVFWAPEADEPRQGDRS